MRKSGRRGTPLPNRDDRAGRHGHRTIRQNEAAFTHRGALRCRATRARGASSKNPPVDIAEHRQHHSWQRPPMTKHGHMKPKSTLYARRRTQLFDDHVERIKTEQSSARERSPRTRGRRRLIGRTKRHETCLIRRLSFTILPIVPGRTKPPAGGPGPVILTAVSANSRPQRSSQTSGDSAREPRTTAGKAHHTGRENQA